MSAELIFYTNPMSRGRIVRWMLEEIDAPYRTEIVEYGEPMKSEPYISINPMGKVPAIQHGSEVVTECSAICAYLADAFPEAGLAPSLDQRAAYYRWLFFAAGPLESAVTMKGMALEVPEDKRGMSGFGTMEAVVNALEQALSNNEYVAGDAFSAADVYLGSQIGWALQFGTIEARPAFREYFDRISSRPAWQRAKEMDDALVPAQS
ncbi:MAG: glutathione S-transferase family protein [Pseudomonadota bacterium]